MGPISPSTDAAGARPRVLLLLSWLNGGGAERAALHILNTQGLGELDVRMGLLRRAGPYLRQADASRLLHRDWCERWFPSEGTDTSFYRLDRLLMSGIVAPLAYRSMIREAAPDVVMSFGKGTNIVTYLALAGMGRDRPRWILREGNNIARHTADEASGPLGRKVAMALTRRAYRAADCVLANSAELAGTLQGLLGLDPARLRVINNPVDVDRVRAAAVQPLPDPPARPFIVAVGRLERQKGHDLLLRAFADSAFRESHDLVIVGEGSWEAELRALVASLGLEGRVRIGPFVDNPWAWVARADLFVLPSRWEGFPNALAEALACGTPALAADCRFGPGELIEQGESGWLVKPEDVDALRAAMDGLVADPALRARLAEGGKRRIERFRLEAILPLYTSLFREQAELGARAAAPGAAAAGEDEARFLLLEGAD